MDRVYFGDISKVAGKERDSFLMSPLLISCKINHFQNAKALLENGSDPNEQDNMGNSCLIFAASYGDLEMVKLLWAHGGKLDHQNNDKRSVYYWAYVNQKQNILNFLDYFGIKMNFSADTIEYEY